MPRPEYDIHFTEEEATTILMGLGELPSKVSFNLLNRLAAEIAKVNQQWQAAQNPAGLPGVPPAAFAAKLQALAPEVVNGTPVAP
jgi:hypothetical protein